jgi:general secretion pathway protein K
MRTTRALSAEQGVILIALLWLLTALTIIALSFSKESFMEISVARNTRDLAGSYYCARAGINAVIYQLMQKRLVPRVQQLELEGAPDPLDAGHVSGQFGGETYDVDIQDESGKVNPNIVSEEQLRALVAAVGINQPDSDIIVDSILDWRDVDKLHRLNGAEDDYYQSLNPPYKAKNGRIDTVEELLLVRGVTREYFYGYPQKAEDGSVLQRYGLGRYFSVYSPANRINLNYAELPVLESIPGITPQVARVIYERRKVKPFKTMNDVTRELPATLPATALAQLSTDQTGFYTLTGSAHRENSKVRRLIRAVVNIDPREPNRHRIIYWNENVADI